MKKQGSLSLDFSFFKLIPALIAFLLAALFMAKYLGSTMQDKNNEELTDNLIKDHERVVLHFGGALIVCKKVEQTQCGLKLSKCKNNIKVFCAKNVLLINKFDLQEL